jgi:MEMO1 family protein
MSEEIEEKLAKGYKIREPLVDGLFYPLERDRLEQNIKTLLSDSKVKEGSATAVISPHASYDYSGGVAADAFKSCSRRQPDSVVLIGPVHREPEDAIILPESDYFSTPMGSVQVDQDLIQELQSCSTALIRNDIPHLEEHCLEVQLPFVQFLFPKAKIVPVLIGKSSEKNVKVLAKTLKVVFDEKLKSTLIVISMNMTQSFEYEKAKAETQILTKAVLSSDPGTILDARQEHSLSSCGIGALAALLMFLHPPVSTRELSIASSADISGEKKSTTFYGSFAIEGGL